jgi:hypothetical protein
MRINRGFVDRIFVRQLIGCCLGRRNRHRYILPACVYKHLYIDGIFIVV